MNKPLRILLATPEAVPFAKTGGLADVAGALPKFLQPLGCEVILVMPYYRMVKQSGLPLQYLGEGIEVPLRDETLRAEIYQGRLDKDIPVYFIGRDEFFDREYLYSTPKGDYFDNAERFIFFTRAVLHFAHHIQFSPDVIHHHEWQTGLIPAYLRSIYSNDPLFTRTATVFTIHNIAYQGLFKREKLSLTGLPREMYNPEGIEFWERINLMKAGIVYADAINTVSQKYSEEIQSPEYGYGLEGILRKRKEDLYGILNGVDYQDWDPSHDSHLIARYDLNDLSGKRECKKDLLKEFGLPPALEKAPLLGMISRLADQKGFDLLAEIIDQLFTFDIGFVLLGTGEQKYHDLFNQIARKYPQKAGIRIAYDDRLAHKIEAGADLFLMPSKYEPCGLNQIYSLKYGTIPVVRATGGLDDTIIHYDPSTGLGNGFKFARYDAKDFLNQIKTAIALYAQPERWTKITRNAMASDFSWRKSAEAYLQLYRKALEKKRGTS
ncbi:MAG: starch synthase [Deltaproteobacteria bacterium RBG_16_49_23]|nr:MAG: starch synthase [Deltaproteobacteria bacterium RBG_16_49_23]